MVVAISKSTVRIMKNNENLNKKKTKKISYKSCINLEVVACGYKIENKKQKCWMLDASWAVSYKIVSLLLVCPPFVHLSLNYCI